MKPKKQQLPKARVMWADYDPKYESCGQEFQVYPSIEDSCRTDDLKQFPVAVIPTATAKQAKATAAFFNLSEEEQANAIAKVLSPDVGKWAGDCARAVLRRIKERR